MCTLLASVPSIEISAFCRRWQIRELAVFGSALREDFGASSDIDILVHFCPDADWGLLDHVRMQQELETVFGRKVDLVTRRAVEKSSNWLRRDEILKTARVIYSQGADAHAQR